MAERRIRALPAAAWLPAARALDPAHGLRRTSRGEAAPPRGAVRRVAQVAVGGLLAALLAVGAAELMRFGGDPEIRRAAPHLTFTGMNDLGPLRERLAPPEASTPQDPLKETT